MLINKRLVKKCSSPACNGVFQLNRFAASISQNYTPGVILCPHCAQSFPGDSKFIFLTHPLSLDEEAKYRAREMRSASRR